MEEFLNLSDNELLELFNTKSEFVIKLKNGTLIHTDDEDKIEEYENNPNLVGIFWSSDFETVYELNDELVRRGLLVR